MPHSTEVAMFSYGAAPSGVPEPYLSRRPDCMDYLLHPTAPDYFEVQAHTMRYIFDELQRVVMRGRLSNGTRVHAMIISALAC